LPCRSLRRYVYLTYTAVSEAGVAVECVQRKTGRTFSTRDSSSVRIIRIVRYLKKKINGHSLRCTVPAVGTRRELHLGGQVARRHHWGGHHCLVRQGKANGTASGSGPAPLPFAPNMLLEIYTGRMRTTVLPGSAFTRSKDPYRVLPFPGAHQEPLMDYEKTGFFGMYFYQRDTWLTGMNSRYTTELRTR
jgi:hypothetical protein